MQYILTEQEFNQGYELLESWREYDIPIGEVYDKSKKLNNQGWFTVIKCTDVEKELYEITVLGKVN